LEETPTDHSKHILTHQQLQSTNKQEKEEEEEERGRKINNDEKRSVF
jgi:hypothetical protein